MSKRGKNGRGPVSGNPIESAPKGEECQECETGAGGTGEDGGRTWRTKAEVDGGVGKTRGSAEVNDLTDDDFLPGLAPDLPAHRDAAEAAAEDTELLPAWFGTYRDRRQKENTFGQDDRILIKNTMEFPYRAICHLEITAKSGRMYGGTGWFGGSRVIFTAGHCCYMHEEGGYVSKIMVYPARNGATKPFTFTAKDWVVTNEWQSSASEINDYGAIFLSDDYTHGSFGYNNFSDSDLMAMACHVVGYPGDKPRGTMWGMGQRLSRVYPQQLKYLIDTMGGQSGSSVMRKDGMSVGIHNYGGPTGNLGTRINSDVMKLLDEWYDHSGSK